ncbi:MAG: enoyl-CoA hydratase/isomerase family protein [Actinomycetota bacterium]
MTPPSDDAPGPLRHLSVELEDGVAVVTLDRPPVNAVDLEVIAEFLATAESLAADAGVRAVVITGTERAFCAGADVSMMRDLSVQNHRKVRRWIHVQAALEDMPKPVIAAIRGYALGGGAELALACDLRVAASDSVIGFPEIELGLFPGAGGTQRLSRAVGPARALRLMMLGERLSGDEAAALGLIDVVVEDRAEVLPTALELARTLAARATRTIGLLKRAVRGGVGRPLEEGLAIEEQAVFELIKTEDAREGLQAFLDRRPPRFTGR